MSDLRLDIENRSARIAELERQLRIAASENEQVVARLRIELRETSERLQRSADEVCPVLRCRALLRIVRCDALCIGSMLAMCTDGIGAAEGSHASDADRGIASH